MSISRLVPNEAGQKPGGPIGDSAGAGVMNMPLSMKYLFFISFLEAFFLPTHLQARLWETSKRAGQLKAEGLHSDCHFAASRNLCFLELAQKTRALAQKEAQKKP